MPLSSRGRRPASPKRAPVTALKQQAHGKRVNAKPTVSATPNLAPVAAKATEAPGSERAPPSARVKRETMREAIERDRAALKCTMASQPNAKATASATPSLTPVASKATEEPCSERAPPSARATREKIREAIERDRAALKCTMASQPNAKATASATPSLTPVASKATEEPCSERAPPSARATREKMREAIEGDRAAHNAWRERWASQSEVTELAAESRASPAGSSRQDTSSDRSQSTAHATIGCAASADDAGGDRAAGPDALIATNSLGLLLQEQGKLEEAEPLFREVLQVRRETLGSTHPDTLVSVKNLHLLLQAQGKLEEAKALLRECAASCRSSASRSPRRWSRGPTT